MTDFFRRTGLLPATAFVVASNAPAAIIRQARILKARYGDLIQICDGVADDIEILAAFNALPDFAGDPAGTKTGRVYFEGHTFNLGTRADIPPLHDAVIEAGSCVFTGEGIRFDSMMDVRINAGIAAGETGNIGVEFEPRTAGPDGQTVVVDSQFDFSSIAGVGAPYPAGGVGLRINCATGHFISNKLEVRNIHGYETDFDVMIPGVGQYYLQNDISIGQLGSTTRCLRVGAAGAVRMAGNTYLVNYMNPDVGGTGAEIYSVNEIYKLAYFDNIGANLAVVFGNSAERITVISTPRLWDFGITDNSAVNTNKVLTGIDHRAMLAVTGSAVYAAAAGPYFEFTHGALATGLAEANVQLPAPRRGIAKNLRVRVTANTLAGGTGFILRLNGGDTALSLTIGAGATGTFSDTTHKVQVAAADLIDWIISLPGGAGNITVIAITADFE